jgi:predicted permease
MNIPTWLHTLLVEIRYSLRQFRRNLLFSGVVILSLGLAIGASTAIFGLMDGTLLGGNLPVRDPHKLVMLTSPNEEGRSTGMAEKERDQLSYPEFVQLRQQLTSLSGLCAAGSALQEWHARIGSNEQETIFGKLVSEEYFSVLGVDAEIGRVFNANDATAPGQDPYTVISYDFWQRRFGGKVNVLGTPITLSGASLTIIGVAAPGFKGESLGRNADLWIPMMMQPAIYPGRDWLHEDPSQSLQKVMWLNAFGRLKSGVSMAKLQAEVNVTFHGMLEAFYPATLPPDLKKRVMSQYLVVRDAHAGTFPGRDAVALQLTILLAVAGVVLLIACFNVANLLMAKTISSTREMGVRLSLGSSRMRVYRRLLVERLLIWSFGGIAGFLIALAGTHVLITLICDPHEACTVPDLFNWHVIGFTAGLTLITTVLFGMTPAMRSVPSEIASTLGDGGRAFTQSGGRRQLVKGLVIGQVALSFLLTIISGLLIRTIWNLQKTPLGYAKEHLLQVDVDGVSGGYKDDALINFYNGLVDRMNAIPGVRGAAYSETGLLTGGESRCRIQIDDVTPERIEDRRAHYDYVSPGFFAVLGVPLLQGRDIGLQDTATSPKVVLINQEFATHHFPGLNPIGRHITALSGNNTTKMEIVGVVKNLRADSLRGEIGPNFYVPIRQAFPGEDARAVVFQLRTVMEPKAVLPTVRSAIFDANPNATILFSETMEEIIADQTLTESQIARLCSIFCSLALLLAAIGLYGVLADGVARRKNEIGIRMAVGATPAKIIGMVLLETGVLTVTGLVLGLIAAGVSTGLIASYLFGISRMDYVTIAFAFVLVSSVAMLSGFLPAYRAGKVNPLEALRDQ